MPKHARPRRVPAVLLSGRWITTAALATAAVAVTTANAAPSHSSSPGSVTAAPSQSTSLEPTAWTTPASAHHGASEDRSTAAIPTQRAESRVHHAAIPRQRSTGATRTAAPSAHATRPSTTTAPATHLRTAEHATTSAARTTTAARTAPVAAQTSAAPTATGGTAQPGAASTTAPSTTAAPTTQATGNLDTWIKDSLAVMAANHIPGTYDGIYRNIMRESSGNPQAINLTDSNAAAGHPSKGLLQVIDPTFQAYHVPGTSTDIYDPVANITAACNYAAHFYGSIDNVNGPY
ncbi:transglycosylase SLT domain-containing protein [Kitasatospora paranensis]|uniref:Transglycosylase SLT domain-containing protein n=1 Tax=Kitasatospora paranensis TaxID=258053 RepID=A0ABW2FMY3_9ACTN